MPIAVETLKTIICRYLPPEIQPQLLEWANDPDSPMSRALSRTDDPEMIASILACSPAAFAPISWKAE